MLFPVLISLALLGQTYILKEVKVENARWYSSDFLKTLTGLHEGLRISGSDLKKSLRRMISSHFYDDASYTAQLYGDSISVTFKVVENPRVSRFKFGRIKKFTKEEIRDSLRLRRGKPVSSILLFEWQEKLRELYRREGYWKADVSISLSEPTEDGFVVVSISVDEGKKFKIGGIAFVGNKHYPDSILKRKIRTKEHTWWGGRATLDMEKLNEDLLILEAFYRTHGFPSARVDSFTIDEEENLLFITFYISEGQKYYFGNAGFEGNELFSTEFLDSIVSLENKPPWLVKLAIKLGKPIKWESKLYSELVLLQNLQKINQLYGDSGYLYAQVIPKEVTRDDSIMDVVFHIIEGERFRVRKVVIEGNTRTSDWVIRRELEIFPGDYFSSSKVIKSRRNLTYLGYFEQVDFTFERADSGLADVIFKIKEKETGIGKFGFGSSYSSTYGLSFYIELEHPNFLGRGQNIKLHLEKGAKFYSYQFSFNEPWLLGRPVSAGVALYDMKELYLVYSRKIKGFSLLFGKRFIGTFFRTSVRYALEQIWIEDVAAGYEPLLLKGVKNPFLSSKVSFVISYDSRDYFFNATKGRIWRHDLEIAGGPLKGDVHYHLNSEEIVQYIPISKLLITVLRLKAGVIGGLKVWHDVPAYAKFWIGGVGPYGLRGYEDRSIGPGMYCLIFNLEERIRLSEKFYALLFFDAGNTWSSLEDISWKHPYTSFKKGIGVGVRTEMPMFGIIGIDFGYSLERKEWTTHFQFGSFY